MQHKDKSGLKTALAAAQIEIERLTHLLDLSKKTTEAVLERAEKAEAEAEFFKSEVKLRNRIPSTNDTAADLLRRDEKAEAERDAALKEQDRLAKAWEAKHDYQVKQSKSHADYFDKSQRRMHELVRERDEARAQVAAAYEAAEKALESRKYGDPDEREECAFDAALDRGIVAIRALAPDHAKAALEAYGREKVREGMQRAAGLVSHSAYGTAYWAIIAEMEKLK